VIIIKIELFQHNFGISDLETVNFIRREIINFYQENSIYEIEKNKSEPINFQIYKINVFFYENLFTNLKFYSKSKQKIQTIFFVWKTTKSFKSLSFLNMQLDYKFLYKIE